MRITREQLRRVIVSETRRVLRENGDGDPAVEAMHAFAERFGYQFFDSDPEGGGPYVSAGPSEGEEVVYLNDDGQLVFSFPEEGSQPITVEQLEEMTASGEDPYGQGDY